MQPIPVVRRLAGVLLLEAVAVTVTGIVYAVAGALGSPENRLGAELAAGCAVLLGGCLAVLARATIRLRRWPRSPAVVLNVIALPVGYGLAQGHLWVAAAAVLGPSLTVLYLYSRPEAREALRETG